MTWSVLCHVDVGSTPFSGQDYGWVIPTTHPHSTLTRQDARSEQGALLAPMRGLTGRQPAQGDTWDGVVAAPKKEKAQAQA